MSDSATTVCDSAKRSRNLRAFDRWSQSYDAQSNPLLTLEKRYLEELLPRVADRDVLDAGCGSGRWLSYFAEQRPRTICGVDASAGMLRAAALKHIPHVKFTRCSCTATPFEDRSFDTILASFLLSYIDDLDAFAIEINRIAREDCDLFLSDMHPETQQKLAWKRAFHDGNSEVVLETVSRSVQEIANAFGALGWETLIAIEPEFDAPEREVFEAAGRLARYRDAEGHPAIYLLHLRKRWPAGVSALAKQKETVIHGGRCALGPQECTAASIRIKDDRIAQIAAEQFLSMSPQSLAIDLSGYLLMPGFINAHDHLEFSLFPRLASSHYTNASAWAKDIHQNHAALIARHRAVPKDVRLWWGGLRNLLCGVTTVCHHNPVEQEFQRDDFPVRVVRDFGWAHSLAFGGDLRKAHAATPSHRPFMVHACEGIDDDARNEIHELNRLGVLDENTVLIHGLALDEEGIALLRECQASLVICPSSNRFLFGCSPDMEALRSVRNIALGSDSPLTASGDLLDEARFAASACDIPAGAVYSMVTKAAATILQLHDSEGSIAVCGAADLIAIRDIHLDPINRLPGLSAADVEFVMTKGNVQLASQDVMERLPRAAKAHLEPILVGGILRWLRAPVRDLLQKAEEILGIGAVQLGGRPVALPPHVETGYAR